MPTRLCPGAGNERLGLANPAPKIFVIFGNQRTGSTFVASRLNSHPRITCYEEVLLPWADSSPSLRNWLRADSRPQWLRTVPSVRISFLNFLIDSGTLPQKVDAIGFKLMYNQLSLWPKFSYLAPKMGRVFQDHALLSWLRANQVVIIHTVRRNRLRTVVSHCLASRSGRFHSRDIGVRTAPVVLPIRGLKARLRRIETAEKVARNAIRGLPCLEVYYEDYTGAAGKAHDVRLCTALGQAVPVQGLWSPLRKVSSDDLCETVANYDQVVAHLSGTRFEKFLT